MPAISSISLAFGVVQVVYLATTGRSTVSSTKTLPTSICNDRKSISIFILFFFVFSLFQIPILSGLRFRTNQTLSFPSDSIIHCSCVRFIAFLPKVVLIQFESNSSIHLDSSRIEPVTHIIYIYFCLCFVLAFKVLSFGRMGWS